VRGSIAALLVAGLLLPGCGGGSSSDHRSDGEVKLGGGEVKAPPRTRPIQAARARKPAAPPAPSRPPIVRRPIPFGPQRVRETAAYAERHYGRALTTLKPKVIVEHYTVTPTFQATFNTFARDVPDVELHELPGVCSHFVVDRDGTIYQLVRLTRICRHTVGLNQVAIGIEHVGSSDSQVLGDARQLAASVRLTSWLRCRHGIAVKDVIGHAESLSSPYHQENVPSLKNQTHQDFQGATMDRYRRRLASHGC
jgi:N-acetylmuramoyl-L-alanine amidase